MARHAQALLSLNLGVEGMQLAVVVCVMPPLLVLAARAPVAYCWLRGAAAVFAVLTAGIWTVERLLPEAPKVMERGLTIAPWFARIACVSLGAAVAALLISASGMRRPTGCP